MPRPPARPKTALGVAVQAERLARDLRLHDLAVVLQLSDSTLARIERGTHTPSLDTALALARWLGWTVEQVVDAARAPVDQSSEG